MAPSGGRAPPFRRPPLLPTHLPFLSLGILRNLGGTFVTIFLLAVLLLLSPILLTFRIVGYVKRKDRRWQYSMRNCSHNWPLIGTAPDLGILTLSSEVDAERLNFNVNDVSLGVDEKADEEMCGLRTGNVVRQWNQSDRPLKTPQEVSLFLNESSPFQQDKVDIRVTNNYSTTGKPSSLVLVSNPSKNLICLPRLFSVLSNQRMYLEMEPLPSYHFFMPFRHNYCLHNFFVVSFRLLTAGAACLLAMLFRSKSPLWAQLSGESKKRSGKNRRTPRTRDSSTDNGPEEVVIHSKENGSFRASSLLSTEHQTTHARCWRAVPNMELVGRAERLLRATTSEMMLALVAGTLRAYCREQGIPYPPDVGCLVPVACRNFLPVACGYPCDVMSFPLRLPLGVEGTIPRVWTVQKRLLEGLNGHVPAALKIAQIFVRFFATKDSSASWLRPLFTSNSIHVTFYRASGDFKLARNAAVESIHMFPSLDPGIKASFVFIQCGKTIQMCASLCRKTFPDPNTVMNLFEKETHHLLEHLAVRLLSLPQSTFLPGMQQFAEETEDEENPSASDYLREKTTPKKQDKECSLEELHQLLATVQQELDGMRANPQGDRAEYIRKLGQLEGRMQSFHDSITERLGLEGGVEGEEDIVENVLAPYKDLPVSSGERRYSRDLHRDSEHRARRTSRSSM